MNNNKIEIGIMAQCDGIVPAIYGGAVETSFTIIIDKNEGKFGIRHRNLLKFIDMHEIYEDIKKPQVSAALGQRTLYRFCDSG